MILSMSFIRLEKFMNGKSFVMCPMNTPSGGNRIVNTILNRLVGKQNVPYPKPPYTNLSYSVYLPLSIL